MHQRLANVYAGVGAWDAQRESLERALARTSRSEDRRAIYVALGELYEERIPSPKRAAESYERALELDPRAMPALSGLERICRTTEQYARLATILDQQVDAATSDEERVAALLRLGELLEQRFVKPREAVPKYELALELDADSTRARDGLERCWHALRDWEKLASSLERRAAAAKDSREAIAVLMRLAEVREAKQESVDLALAAWRRLYELDTSHVPAIQQLARLSEKQGDITARRRVPRAPRRPDRRSEGEGPHPHRGRRDARPRGVRPRLRAHPLRAGRRDGPAQPRRLGAAPEARRARAAT